MKCFSLDNKGDVTVNKNRIEMVEGSDLIIQKIRQILLTNYGEWWLDKKEGLNQRSIFVKNPNYQLIKDEIRQAINQVDNGLAVDNIEFVEDIANRHLIINMNINGKELKMEV
jgi:hypothetical protein|nr:MAG TPA: baseplate wedge protein [Caudoviricetes sp.]